MKSNKFLYTLLLVLVSCLAIVSLRAEDTISESNDLELVLAQHEAVPITQPFVPIAQKASIPKSTQASIAEYGLLGSLALGVLGLLAYSIKSDKSASDRHSRSLEKLADAIDALRISNTSLIAEIRNGNHEIRRGFDQMHEDLTSKIDGLVRSQRQK